jgi:hypothetical protein
MFILNVVIAYVSYSVRRGERVDRKKLAGWPVGRMGSRPACCGQ